MLEFKNITKTYPLEHGRRKVIFENISFVFPEGKNIALLGSNGAGKSTTLRLIAGSDYPDSGKIIRKGKLSWPLGFSGGFHQNLTGEENLRFVCRIYGADLREVKAYVEEFAELGEYLYQPIKTYSSGMRARLAFGLSLAIRFDVYLIDELTAVGDSHFKKKSIDAFKELRKTSNIIMTSHNMGTLREYCDIALLLKDGRMHIFENLDDGIAAYEENGDFTGRPARNKVSVEASKESSELIKTLQFHYIKEKSILFHKAKQPVLVVDTKRNRTGGPSGINGQRYPFNYANKIDIDAFLESQKGEVAASGNFDLARDKSWVCAGIFPEGIQFTVNSIRNWWHDKEVNRYSDAKEVYLIYLNAGRDELKDGVINKWNAELQKLADELKVIFHVSLVPPRVKRWDEVRNKIFNFNIQGDQDAPFINKAVVVGLMGNVKSGRQLKVKVRADDGEYYKYIEETAEVNLQVEEFYGKWNYRLYPNR